MSTSRADIVAGIQESGLSGRPVCVHSSLRSFGHIEGGAETLLGAFLDEGATLLVPSFSWQYAAPAPLGHRPDRNGTEYDYASRLLPEIGFSPRSTAVDRDMGALAAAVVRHPGRERGNHPICSFTALGPMATTLVASQGPHAVWAPLERLVALDGAVVSMGVDLTSLSLIHLGEQHAGRRPFIRWALDATGSILDVEAGSCSNGFARFEPALADEPTIQVGESRWLVLPARGALALLTATILDCPTITKCADPECERCRDAVAGGPLMSLGTVERVSSSPRHTLGKSAHESIRLLEGLGVEGDAHLGKTVKHRSRVRRDPSQPNLRQVHLIHGELHDELALKGMRVGPGEMGENVTTRGIDLLHLPAGTILRLGDEARVEVTGLRNPCAQLDSIQGGLMAATLDRADNGSLLRKAGIMSIVVRGGTVRTGDSIVADLPPGPHHPLDRV